MNFFTFFSFCTSSNHCVCILFTLYITAGLRQFMFLLSCAWFGYDVFYNFQCVLWRRHGLEPHCVLWVVGHMRQWIVKCVMSVYWQAEEMWGTCEWDVYVHTHTHTHTHTQWGGARMRVLFFGYLFSVLLVSSSFNFHLLTMNM